MEAWIDAIHYICLSSQISDTCVFNKSVHSFNQEYPIVGTLDSTAGKRDTKKNPLHRSATSSCIACLALSGYPGPISDHFCQNSQFFS